MAERVKALLPFNVPRDVAPKEELSFNAGDIITVIDKGSETGWWTGICNGVEGLFPNCLTSPVVTSSSKRSFAGRGILVEGAADARGRPLPTGTGLIVLALNPQRTHLLCLVCSLSSLPPATPPRAEDIVAVPVSSVATDIVLALYPYNASDASDLTVEPGDIIAIRRRWNDSWWEGTLIANSNTDPPTRPPADANVHGIFPSTFVRQNEAPPMSSSLPVPTADQPPLCILCVQPLTTTAAEVRYSVNPAALGPPTSICSGCVERMAVVDRIQKNLSTWRLGSVDTPPDLFAGTQTLWSESSR